MGVPEYLMREVGAYGRDAAVEVAHAGLLGLGSGIVGVCLMLGAVRLLGYSPDIVKLVTIASLALIPTGIPGPAVDAIDFLGGVDRGHDCDVC